MTICLVTDRRRTDPVAQARAAASEGIDLLQVRERDLEGGALAALVRDILAVTRGSRTRIVVNDRVDVALATGAAGVHLRADSVPVASARRIAPSGFLVGRSIHSIDEAIAASEADYLIAGTVLPSGSKPDVKAYLGEHGLRAIVESIRTPVLAIGGVSLDTVDTIARAGAAGVAAIGAFVPPEAIPAIVRALRSRFDTAKTAP